MSGIGLARKYPFSESALLGNSAERNYWLGFLMADATIYPGAIVLELHHKDLEHIDAFRSFLRSSAPIKPIKPRGWSRSENMRFCLSSKKMSEHVQSFGITERKSKSAEVIGLESDRDFWRGVVDGDGTLGFMTIKHSPREYRFPLLKLVGSERICEQFLEFANRYTKTKAKVRLERTASTVFLSGKAARGLVDVLYRDNCRCLARKGNIAGKIREWRSLRDGN